MLSDQDKEISCLKIHNQNLEDEIRKSKNDNKSPYGSNNDFEEEINHLNKIIMEKDVELVQVRMNLENQEIELRHRKQRKEKIQQQYDDSKKTHKLELTKVNKVLSSNSEEIFILRNHNKTLVTKIKKLKSSRKIEQSTEDIEGKLLDKQEENRYIRRHNEYIKEQIKKFEDDRKSHVEVIKKFQNDNM